MSDKITGTFTPPLCHSISIDEILESADVLKREIVKGDNEIIRGIFRALKEDYDKRFDDLTLDKVIIVFPEKFRGSKFVDELMKIERLTVTVSPLTEGVIIAKKPEFRNGYFTMR